jgi:hypothetical protein
MRTSPKPVHHPVRIGTLVATAALALAAPAAANVPLTRISSD